MALSKQHKEALVQGKAEALAIKRYLEMLGSRRPGRPVTAKSLKTKIEAIDAKIDAEENALRRVKLHQDRINAEAALASVGDGVNANEVERDFVKAVKGYSARKGITYSAWRKAGVSAAVLKKAGVGRTRRK